MREVAASKVRTPIYMLYKEQVISVLFYFISFREGLLQS